MGKIFVTILVVALSLIGGSFLGTPQVHAAKYSEKAQSFLNGDESPIKNDGRHSKNSKRMRDQKNTFEEERTELTDKKSRKHNKKHNKNRKHKKAKQNTSSENMND